MGRMIGEGKSVGCWTCGHPWNGTETKVWRADCGHGEVVGEERADEMEKLWLKQQEMSRKSLEAAGTTRQELDEKEAKMIRERH